MADTTLSRDHAASTRPAAVLRHFGEHERRASAVIVIQTVLLSASHIGAALALHFGHFRTRMLTPTMSLVMSFAVVQTAAILALLALLLIRKLRRQLGERRIEQVRPMVFECLASHAAGIDQRAEIRRLTRSYLDVVEGCLVELLPSITGSGRMALSQLALDLGLIRRWQKSCRSPDDRRRAESVAKLGQIADAGARRSLLSALSDANPEVRLEAARVLLKSASTNQLDRIFAFTLAQPLFVRAILIDELRPHVAKLATSAIPACLRSGDDRRVLRTLEAIEAWRKALPLDVAGLLEHPNLQIRCRALAVMPYVSGANRNVGEIVSALGESAPAVQAAAAGVAGKLGITEAIPQLEQVLCASDDDAARAAAAALASLPGGSEVLEHAVMSPDRHAAAIALEALERVRTGRAESVVR